MSTLPGLTLERFLMWNYDLIVDGDGRANPSLQIAETLRVTTGRVNLTREEFAPIVSLFEPFRERVEETLQEFDDDNQSWRDYAGYMFDFIPPEVYHRGVEILPR